MTKDQSSLLPNLNTFENSQSLVHKSYSLKECKGGSL